MKKLRVGVIYGGRSGEHEVSIASAAAIFKHLDRTRYEAVPIRIEKDGRWVLADKVPLALSASEVIEQSRHATARAVRAGRETLLVSHPSEDTLVTIERRPAAGAAEGEPDGAVVTGLGLDVVFPVLHGPYGEDGTVQGLLELAGVPYVGSGVLGSSLSMDKAMAKQVLTANGVAQARSRSFREHEITPSFPQQLVDELGLPLFVKPANMGSSVGVSKAKTVEAVRDAIDLALSYDEWVVVEEAITGREIEVAVLGNLEPRASVPGEIVPGAEFYDYADKYLDDGSQAVIPARLSPEATAEVQALAVRIFHVLRCEGMARVDFFFEDGPGGRGFLCNEVNTIPGFTPISMYPKLWIASGLSYAELIDELVRLALERQTRRRRNTAR